MRLDNSMTTLAVVLTIIALAGLIVTIVKVNDFWGLTGESISDTETAIVNVTVLSHASISFLVNTFNFGSGQVDTDAPYAVINTEGTVTSGNWTSNNTALTLRNDGNVNVTLNFTTSNTASSFVGGTSPSYKLKLSDSEAGSCAAGNNSLSSYTEATGSLQAGCAIFNFLDSKDTLDLDIELRIPEDALPGTRGSTITATATVV